METAQRTLVKSISWQALGIVSVTALSYPHTGTLAGALSLATSASITGFICFFLHERIWSRIGWGRRDRHHH